MTLTRCTMVPGTVILGNGKKLTNLADTLSKGRELETKW